MQTTAQGTDPVYDGNVYDSQIAQQIAILNGVYGPIGFTFQLAGTTRTLNQEWFAGMAANSAQEAAAQSALHTGGLNTVRAYADVLNLDLHLVMSQNPGPAAAVQCRIAAAVQAPRRRPVRRQPVCRLVRRSMAPPFHFRSVLSVDVGFSLPD